MKKYSLYGLLAVTALGLLSYPVVQKTLEQQKQAQVRQKVATKRDQLRQADEALFERSQKAYHNNFYYNQLSKEERIEYGRFVESLRTFAPRTDFRLHDDWLGNVYLAVTHDFPEFYWLSEEATFAFDQNTYPEDVKETYQALHQIADEIIAQLPQGSDYDKVKFLYEYIIQNTQYNVAALTDNALAYRNQGIRSVFLDKLSVCAGYSRAFQFLCQKAGLTCLYVVGDITAYEEPHAWNLVKIDGKYYPVDTTWGDPNFEEAVAQQNTSAISYAYLCMPQQLFDDTHKSWGGFFEANAREIIYPKFSHSDRNYFKLTGTYLETFNPDQLGQLALNHLSTTDMKEVAIQFGSKETLDQFLAALETSDTFMHLYLEALPAYQGFDLHVDQFANVIHLSLVH